MLKPTSLREALVAALPALHDNPEHLRLTTGSGRIVSTLAASLSFEAHYPLTLTLAPFSGELEAVITPLLAWLRVNQPDVMSRAAEQPGGIGWQLTTADDGSQRLEIQLTLSERAIVSQQEGSLHTVWVPEPQEPAPVTRPVELWMKDELVSRQSSPDEG